MNQTEFKNEQEGSLLEDKRIFIQLSESIAALSAQSGIRVLPYFNKELRLFGSLDSAGRKSILAGLSGTQELYLGAINAIIRLEEGRKFVWFAMKKLGLRPSFDLFERLSDDSIIEIHNTDRQLFRSFSYFSVCSYSLEELSCLPWPDLYLRNKFLEEQLKSAVMKTLETKQITYPNIREHFVEEASSPFKYKGIYSVELMAPLSSTDSRDDYFLVSIRVDLINKKSAAEQEQQLLDYYASIRQLNSEA